MLLKNVLLIIGGGISAYKSLDLIRELKQENFNVTPVITKSGSKFVTPLSVSTLSENNVYTDIFDYEKESQIGHIKLAREADIIVVAPATADLIAKFANGIADDLATTIFLASYSKKIVVPAMNVAMWANNATKRNVEILKNDGIIFVGPEEGTMACGEYGVGRIAENKNIINSIICNERNKTLEGKKVLITSGPTIEPIDPVRYITNYSSGSQGYHISECMHDFGADVTFISGPTNLGVPRCKNFFQVQTADEMYNAIPNNINFDVAICVAAVSDWKFSKKFKNKIKKEDHNSLILDFEKNIDILYQICNFKNRPQLVIGFAAETQNIFQNAKKKLVSKGCDWIIANDVNTKSGFMGKNENEIKIITEDSSEDIKKTTKKEIALILTKKIIKELV